MSLFFNYDNSVCAEGNTASIFSSDPIVYSLKELLLYELSRVSYYSVKIAETGKNVKDIDSKTVKYIYLIFTNNDYSRDKLLTAIKEIYDFTEETENRYKKICEEIGTEFLPVTGDKIFLKNDGKKNDKSAIRYGEQRIIHKNTKLSKIKKRLSDIALILMTNASSNLEELNKYGYKGDEFKHDFAKLMYSLNYSEDNDNTLKEKLLEFSKTNNDITSKLYETINKNYGPFEKTSVGLDSYKGKAVLVSGHFYKNLEMLLKSLTDEDIDVYTHGDMIFAHALKGFKKYKNLRGHFQKSPDNYRADFASFPGPVLLTENSLENTDTIRGRIFTSNENSIYGMSKISNEDYSEIIKVAKNSKGFKKDLPKGSIQIGYDKEALKTEFAKILKKLSTDKIKHLFITGLKICNTEQKEYFEKLIEFLPADCQLMSFSYGKNKRNIYFAGTYINFGIILLLINEAKHLPENIKSKITLMFPGCDTQTISFAVYAVNLKFKNIFIGQCCRNAVSPSVIDGLNDIFNIKEISNVFNDLNSVIN